MNSSCRVLFFTVALMLAAGARGIEDENRDFNAAPPPKIDLSAPFADAPAQGAAAGDRKAAASEQAPSDAAGEKTDVAETAGDEGASAFQEPENAAGTAAPESEPSMPQTAQDDARAEERASSLSGEETVPAGQDVPDYFKNLQSAWDDAPATSGAAGAESQLERSPARVSPSTSAMTEYALRSVSILLAICGIIVLGGWLFKKYGGKTSLAPGQGLGKVLGHVHLGPRAALIYVKTGGRILVLGVTPQNVNPVAEFEAAEFETVQPAPASIAPFLAQLHARQTFAPAAEDEEITSLKGDIQRLKDFLRESKHDAAE